jgi:hypothetical protein
MARTMLQIIALACTQAGKEVITGTGDGGDTNTLTDADVLKIYPDARLNGMYLYTDGASTPAEHVISSNDASAGSADFFPALGSGDYSGDTFHILPYPRQTIIDAIHSAIVELYERDLLVREFQYNGIIGGSMIFNGAFEAWDISPAVPTGWTLASASVIPASPLDLAGNTWPHRGGVQFTSAATGTLRTSDLLSDNYMLDFLDKKVRVKALVRAGDSGMLKVGLKTNRAATDNYSSSNGSTDIAEILDTGLVTPDAGEINTVEIHFTDLGSDVGAVHYVWTESDELTVKDYQWPVVHAPKIDAIWECPSPIYSGETTLEPFHAIGGRWVKREDWKLMTHTQVGGNSLDTSNSGRSFGTLRFANPLKQATRYVAECRGPLQLTSGDSDEIEVGRPESYLIANIAAMKLIRDQLPRMSGFAREAASTQIQDLGMDTARMLSGFTSNASVDMPRVL